MYFDILLRQWPRGARSRDEHACWHVSKMVLLSGTRRRIV
jgi:hypothetical protein